MNAFLLGAVVFAAVMTTEIITEVTVDNLAHWNSEMFEAGFWEISPRADGTESERLAQRILAELPPMDKYDYLCEPSQ
ncbi:MAG: hypothetical protein HOL85_17745 [Rhodospirillaceae bacterium]|jgi:hypothetical protein|nr:hypothetical protein [Rhodospirillaceae bacterium]MBT6137912.1 hypothetical protein [Rhodospirillaceae bacterium]